MDEYQYKPILSKEQIAKHLKFRRWVDGIAYSLMLINIVLVTWVHFSGSENSANTMLLLVVFVLVPVVISALIEPYNPNCKRLRRADQARQQRLGDEFEEVERRVASILSEPGRDYVTRYEFAEIEKRVAELPACSPMSDRAKLLALNQEMAEIIKRL